MRSLAQAACRAVSTLGLLTLAGAGVIRAQEPLDPNQPIIVKQKPPKTEYDKFEGRVMHATSAEITVRGIQDELTVRTFSLSPELSKKMQKVIAGGGYQYGDKVKIWYDRATEKAVKIRGKPSRPI